MKGGYSVMKKKKNLFIILGVVLVAIIVYFNLTGDSTKTTDVVAAAVEGRDLVEIVSASGRIQPKTKVDITSEVNGEIVYLPVKEGQRVGVGGKRWQTIFPTFASVPPRSLLFRFPVK